MSELREDLNRIYSIFSNLDVHNGVIKLTDKGWGEVKTAFKAHIEECERPENHYKLVICPETKEWAYESGAHNGFKQGIKEDRKALMESLE